MTWQERMFRILIGVWFLLGAAGAIQELLYDPDVTESAFKRAAWALGSLSCAAGAGMALVTAMRANVAVHWLEAVEVTRMAWIVTAFFFALCLVAVALMVAGVIDYLPSITPVWFFWAGLTFLSWPLLSNSLARDARRRKAGARGNNGLGGPLGNG